MKTAQSASATAGVGVGESSVDATDTVEGATSRQQEKASGPTGEPPALTVLSPEEQARCENAVNSLSKLRPAIEEASGKAAAKLTECAVEIALLSVSVGTDPNLLLAIHQAFKARHPSLKLPSPSAEDQKDALKLLPLLVLPDPTHKHKRTSVRYGAAAVLAFFKENKRQTDEDLLTNSKARSEMEAWIKKNGGVTGLYNAGRAEARKAKGHEPLQSRLAVTIGTRAQAALDTGTPILALLVPAPGKQPRVILADSGNIEVLPAQGRTLPQVQKDLGGDPVGDGALLVPADGRVFVALAEGQLRLRGALTLTTEAAVSA